jgi:hypothetical protein
VPASGCAISSPRTADPVPTTARCLVPMAPVTAATRQTCTFLRRPPERVGLSGPKPPRRRRR